MPDGQNIEVETISPLQWMAYGAKGCPSQPDQKRNAEGTLNLRCFFALGRYLLPLIRY